MAFNRISNSRFELSALIKQILCENPTINCYSRDCQNCGTSLPSFPLYQKLETTDVDESDDITWMIWDRSEKRTELQRNTTSVATLLDKIDFLWPKLLLHHFHTIEQHDYIKKIKAESSDNGTAIVQLDFVQNFTFFSQAAVQSSYWGQQQATIFTVHVKLGKGHRNLAFISDYMKHTTEFVHQAQGVIVNFIKRCYPNVKRL